MTNILTHGAKRLTAATLLACSVATPALAGDAYWYGYRSGSWNDGIFGNSSNWYSKDGETPRNPPTDTAIITPGAQRACCWFKQDRTKIKKIVIREDADRAVFQLTGKQEFLITGTGFINNKTRGFRHEFRLSANARLRFKTFARIGGRGPGPVIYNDDYSRTTFDGDSDGGDAVLYNRDHGSTLFLASADAGKIIITNVDYDSSTSFRGFGSHSTRATIYNDKGLLEFSSDDASVSHIGNSKRMQLSSNAQLTVLKKLDLNVVGYPLGNLNIRMPGKDAKLARITVFGEARLGGELRVISKQVLTHRRYLLIWAAKRTGEFDSHTFLGEGLVSRNPRIVYRDHKVYLVLD